MGQLIRSVMRYVPSPYGSCDFEIRLVYWPNAEPTPCYTLNTPCACLHATGNETEADLHRTHHRTTFATAVEAQVMSQEMIRQRTGFHKPKTRLA